MATATPQLVKIKEVILYTGLTEGAADCVRVLKLLKSEGIKYTLLNYSDQDHQHVENFNALGTWTFGPGEGYKKVFTDYPILLWKECFDNWDIYQHAATGIDEISSVIEDKLIPYAEKV